MLRRIAPLPAVLLLIAGADLAGASRASSSDPAFDRTVRRAAAGDPAGLRDAAVLRDASDAARAEAIDQALSTALTTNPAAVLRLIAADRRLPGVAWLCQDRAIEPTPAADAAFRARATRAVRAVREPALRASRDRCLAALARAPR